MIPAWADMWTAPSDRDYAEAIWPSETEPEESLEVTCWRERKERDADESCPF